jgi:hypothetical protein
VTSVLTALAADQLPKTADCIAPDDVAVFSCHLTFLVPYLETSMWAGAVRRASRDDPGVLRLSGEVLAYGLHR